MSEPSEKPPPTDPAAAHIETDGDHEARNKEDRPRDSKGWDGKLRLDKSVLVDGPHEPGAQSDAEESEDEGPPPEQLAADEDLLDDFPEDEDEIDLVHLRISSIPALRLERFRKLKRLCLRQNQITDVEIPEVLAPTLVELDLYDNLISHVRGFDAFTELTSLDLSFNKIKHIKRVNHLTKLRDLYFVQNKIGAIEGLEGLSHLRQVELGANRIREIQNLETLTGLEQLWLGKNKITELKGLDTLANLTILSIQSNRLTSITGLSALAKLEELYISHNAITQISGLTQNTNLRVIDVSANPIEHLEGLETLKHLQELWASNCKLDSFQEIEAQLRDKEELETVYFEGNPLQRKQMALYRNKVRLALPQVKQIDATFVRVS
ncbi:L domain-like protein [Lentithecium fluviatile CBS 122367]|uniref:L domain-like protein n=1 Tax=Lentithecium fluviatile CBS 122367 TaxID=1168545 RepID=A0A6G1II64_9PLEO|nr:L domain-like protein [Lentithecium fluviatile CBS 122367]